MLGFPSDLESDLLLWDNKKQGIKNTKTKTQINLKFKTIICKRFKPFMVEFLLVCFQSILQQFDLRLKETEVFLNVVRISKKVEFCHLFC